jgi:hypothetical protein
MLAFSNAAILGKTFVAPIPQSELDKWFLKEELARPLNNGHVFFVHSKDFGYRCAFRRSTRMLGICKFLKSLID